ncbi:MAG: tRNA pseudouridine(55) synthase TruB, partial [Thermoleophilia bacterium]|nr:tRNA pseudouridine(55) synthase TruB [Thermoleophilia bacterium]
MTDGIILCDKPAGITSHDVVARARRRLGRGVKVGHAGTLDPFATGLLLVLVGRATRVQRFLMALPKRYETVARLGWTSTTGDPEGELAEGRMPPEPLVLPTGVLRQVPPAYSAVKIGGERAY